MNREIKFRAFNTRKPFNEGLLKEMVYFNLSDLDEFYICPSETYFGDDECIIMQFTGLLDKNEKEIYESDLIEFGNAEIGEVVWDVENAGFRVKNSLHNIRLEGSNYGKVIGNLYENKELLKP